MSADDIVVVGIGVAGGDSSSPSPESIVIELCMMVVVVLSCIILFVARSCWCVRVAMADSDDSWATAPTDKETREVQNTFFSILPIDQSSFVPTEGTLKTEEGDKNILIFDGWEHADHTSRGIFSVLLHVILAI